MSSVICEKKVIVRMNLIIHRRMLCDFSEGRDRSSNVIQLTSFVSVLPPDIQYTFLFIIGCLEFVSPPVRNRLTAASLGFCVAGSVKANALIRELGCKDLAI
jgi:hypothetical protein